MRDVSGLRLCGRQSHALPAPATVVIDAIVAPVVLWEVTAPRPA